MSERHAAAAARRRAKRGVPADFGAADGTPISNASTIMRDIDAALGVASPPAVEFVFCDGVGVIDGPWYRHAIASLFNFGHALVRYTLPSGEQVVMSEWCALLMPCRTRTLACATLCSSRTTIGFMAATPRRV